MAGFLSTAVDIFNLVTNLRASYVSWISDICPSILKALSVGETVAGAIQEVCMQYTLL